MRGNIFNVSIILLLAIPTIAQNWYPVDKGTGIHNTNYVYALEEYNGNLYMGGIFDSVGGHQENNIALWNGISWSGLAGGIRGPSCDVSALIVFNGNLIVAGRFDSAGNIPVNNIAAWNGTSWSTFGKGLKDWVGSLAVYKGNLYAGGRIDSAGGVFVRNIAEWDGANWQALGKGTGGNENGAILSLASYDSVLYVGGWFDSAGGMLVNHIAQWDGTTWSALGTGLTYGPYSSIINSTISKVNATIIYNGALYAGGTFDSAQNSVMPNIAKWDGARWSEPIINGAYEFGTGQGVFALATNNNKLYLGGSFNTAGDSLVNNIVVWDGSECHTLGSGINGSYPTVYTMAFLFDSVFHDSALYAGGVFTSAGGKKANNLAVWTRDTLTGMIELNSKTENYRIYPNPSTGIFNFTVTGTIEKSSIGIYNMFGEMVYSSQFSTVNSQFSINLNNEPQGIYLYRVVTDKGEAVGSGKLIIR